MSDALPPTHRALVFRGHGNGLTLENVPTPQPQPGSVVVKMLVITIDPQTAGIISGKFSAGALRIPDHFTPGGRGIARVAAVGPDTTSLSVGQLVLVEPFIRGRDNSNVRFLWGAGCFANDIPAIKLQESAWLDGAMADYARLPLENCFPLNENILLSQPSQGGLGYTPAELAILTRHLIAYGGLRSIDVKAGETVIVAPATGAFSGAAVDTALAMGARVIAVGRNLESLKKIAAANPRVQVYQLKGNVEEDIAGLGKFGHIDAYVDISPPAANESTHIRSCLMSLGWYGRASLMGNIMKDIPIPYALALYRSLTIRGGYMYEKEDIRGMIKLVEAGLLKVGKNGGHNLLGEFALKDWEKAVNLARDNPQAGNIVVLSP